MAIKIQLDQKSLNKKIKDYAISKVLPGRIRKITQDSLPRFRTEFKRAFRRTIASKGLLGKYAGYTPFDVQAHFGLTDTLGTQREEDILDIIGRSVTLSRITVRRTQGIYLEIGTKDLESMLLAQVQGYRTDDGGYIDWIEWLLGQGEQPSAGIKFGQDLLGSRSGRAVMVPGFGSWSSQDYNNFSRTGTFIDDILADQIFINNITKILNQALIRKLGR